MFASRRSRPNPPSSPGAPWSGRLGLNEGLVLALLLAAALWLRLAFVRTVDVPNLGDPLDYQARGLHFASHGDFRGSSYRAPGYVAYVGLHYFLFGFRDRPIYMTQALLSTLLVLLLYLIARRAAGPGAGLWAGALAAFFGPLIGYSGVLFAEILFLTLVAAGIWLAVEADARLACRDGSGLALPGSGTLPRPPWGWAAGAGLLLGLATLTRSVALPLALLVPVWYLVPHFGSGPRPTAAAPWRQRLALGAVTLAACLAVLLPWTGRNAALFHRLVPVDTVSGLNLLIGNHPRANGGFTFIDYLDAYQKAVWVPNEAERDSILMKEALGYIRSSPARFWELTRLRWSYFWTQDRDYIEALYHWERIPLVGARAVISAYQTALIALGLAGLLLAWRHRHALLFAGGALYVAAAQSLFYEAPRYRLPALPFLILLGGLALSQRPRAWILVTLPLAVLFYWWLVTVRAALGVT